MKNLILFTLVSILSSFATAGLKAIDTSGTAYLLRDGQNAALVITNEAVKKLAATLHPNEASQLYCGSQYCVIGQINRDGEIQNFENKFAAPGVFDKFVKRVTEPQSYADQGYAQAFGSEAVTFPDQCQDENGRLGNLTALYVEGIAAEQLYNFLNPNKDRPEKSTVFNCLKKNEYDHEDTGDTGAIYPNTPISHVTYRCEIKISPVGVLQREQECKIYGGIISAGGGSGKPKFTAQPLQKMPKQFPSGQNKLSISAPVKVKLNSLPVKK